MPHFGAMELLILLVIGVVFFGAGKIPELGSSLGSGIKNFKKAVNGEEDDDDEEIDVTPKKKKKKAAIAASNTAEEEEDDEEPAKAEAVRPK